MAISHLYPDERPALSLNFARSKVVDPRVSITRTTTATFLGSDGLIQTAAANEGRIDHDPTTGECLGLLMEQSRTNLVVHSNLIDANYSKRIYGTPTYSNHTAPDGATTATKVVGTGSAKAGFDVYPNDYGSNQNAIQTFSVFVKNIDADEIYLSLVSQGNGLRYNFSNETTTLVGSGTTGSVEKYPNGWYRISTTLTKSNQHWYWQAMLDNFQNTSNSVYLWGAQIENGSFPTSYIPTGSSTVTRNGDDAEISSTIFPDVIDPNQGTFLATAKTIEQHTNKMILNMRTTNTSNSFRINVLNDDISLTVSRNYSQQAYLNQADAAPAGINNVAAAYQSDDFAFTANGNTTSTDTSGDPPEQNGSNGALRLQIGSQYTGSNQLNGHVMRIAYYNTRLPNSALEALTK